MAKKYLLYIHEESFDKEPEKSKLVNSLLERHYGKQNSNQKPLKVPPPVEDESCSGTHFMSRQDCGKPGCSWARPYGT